MILFTLTTISQLIRNINTQDKRSRFALELSFPVFINEKSPMLLRDLDVLRRISEQSYLNIGWSIITAEDDETSLVFEPKAPLFNLVLMQ